jgi:hypothetical protein
MSAAHRARQAPAWRSESRGRARSVWIQWDEPEATPLLRKAQQRRRRLYSSVAVGQTSDAFDFLCVCHKVMSLRRSILVAERPLLPAEPLSRGQQRWLLSNSYKGLGLSDSHGDEQGARHLGRGDLLPGERAGDDGAGSSSNSPSGSRLARDRSSVRKHGKYQPGAARARASEEPRPAARFRS